MRFLKKNLMNTYIFTFVIFILSINNINSVYIKESFQKTFMAYNTMETLMLKAKLKDSQDIPYALEIENIQRLAETIKRGTSPIGSGQFGKVFKYDYKPSLSSEMTIKVAAKEIFFNNNYASEKGEEEQNMIEDEINFNLILNQYDPHGLYFPKYYGTYDVTSYFNSLITSNTPSKVKQYLAGTSSQNILTLNMECLDLEIFVYQKQILKNITRPYLHTRLKIGETVANALILFYDKYSHCDLKPENLMAKKLNEEQIAQLADHGIDRIELYPGEFYQIKVIDFGLVAEGNSVTRRCYGGTPSFIPPEFFSNESHKNFDVFSLAMLMLDNETASFGYQFFSFVQEIWFDCMTSHSSLNEEQVETLNSLPYSKMVDLYSTNTKYKALFFEKLRANYAKLDEIVSKNFNKKKPEEVEFSKLKFANPILTKEIFMSALELYIEKDFIQLKKKKMTELANNYEFGSIEAYDMDHDSEKFKIKTDELSLMMYEKSIISAGAPLEQELMLYCISQIKKSANKRDSIQQFLEKLQDIRRRFMEATGENLKNALKHKRYYFAKQNERQVKRDTSMISYEELMKQKRPSFRLDDKFLIRI
jgi:serine/threonine protein kinase